MGLNNTWLIQRLNKSIGDHDNPFSFGGGLTNGGLSKDAMKLLRPIFSFDYMGSAEFEFGAIPESFKNMADNIKDYDGWEININNKSVYVIAPIKHKKEINELLIALSKNKIGLKERSSFPHALGLDKWDTHRECNTIGWLELDNDFLFFTDKEAFTKTLFLFGLLQEI